ncbi:TetR/AcrR family transcriptional regulator [Fructilactobacillus cliffordii]|uniref:TetR/AcrR family transcriptional regulator n=1 Tax=Fructilactobacillus cliffordii TaxID=2940299 RepID=A0A9Q9E0J7_9LACO|nr:TetR/AcrR family transcriptional regulator [Fructilactobacillus cliffordii]USS89271.1 TetR/AcrR family transcriptional regulator [Fructilactobacillus cliffordii]
MMTKQSTHDLLLHAGLTAFLEHGYEQTTLREICRKAHRTTGAFYQYFNSKAELLDELIEPLFKQLMIDYEHQLQHGLDQLTRQNAASVWQETVLNLDQVISVLYENSKLKQLLLFRTDGSRYDQLAEIATQYFTTQIIHVISVMQERGIIAITFQFNYQELHFHAFAFYATVCDILKHDYPQPETLVLTHNLERFFTPSWLKWLGLPTQNS